jgi:hypothetical protein
MNVKRQEETLDGDGGMKKKNEVRAINAYYESRKNRALIQKKQRAKRYRKQGFWETVNWIYSQSHVPFGVVSAR